MLFYLAFLSCWVEWCWCCWHALSTLLPTAAGRVMLIKYLKCLPCDLVGWWWRVREGNTNAIVHLLCHVLPAENPQQIRVFGRSQYGNPYPYPPQPVTKTRAGQKTCAIH